VADALIIGAHAGAVFIVARSGMTTEGEINESVKRLNHAGISPQGVLFNDMARQVRPTPGRHPNTRMGPSLACLFRGPPSPRQRCAAGPAPS
jgi:tyrosine-protein kinase Etk/Wzc